MKYLQRLTFLMAFTGVVWGCLDYQTARKTGTANVASRQAPAGCLYDGDRLVCDTEYSNDASAFLKMSEEQRMEKLFVESLNNPRQPTMQEWADSRPGTEY